MYYRIADHIVEVVIKESQFNSFDFLKSMVPFIIADEDVTADPMFTLVVDDEIQRDDNAEVVGDFDSGDGCTKVWRLADGGYQYVINNIAGNECCLLKTDKAFRHCVCALFGNEWMRRFGLTDAVMFAFAFAGSFRQTLLIHASTVLYDGYGYPFIAKSGTGKSTHSQLWLKHIPDTELMNDDNPVVRFVDGKAMIYGSPWSGKTPCYKQIKAPLGAITRIERALANSIELQKPVQAFASFLPSCSSMKWDHDIYDGICSTIIKIIEVTPVYTLFCLPDEEAARICHKTISKTSR